MQCRRWGGAARKHLCMESTCELCSCDGDVKVVLRPGEVGRDGNSKILDAGTWGQIVWPSSDSLRDNVLVDRVMGIDIESSDG